MKLSSLLFLPLGLLMAAEAPQVDLGKKDLDQMQGSWTVVSVERDGIQLAQSQIMDWVLVIRGNRYILRPGKVSIEGAYKLNPTANPRAINAIRSNGEDNGKTLLGIYALDGKFLTMCFNLPGLEKRPATFATPRNSGFTLYTFKRSEP